LNVIEFHYINDNTQIEVFLNGKLIVLSSVEDCTRKVLEHLGYEVVVTDEEEV
jgi:hypothetical protein